MSPTHDASEVAIHLDKRFNNSTLPLLSVGSQDSLGQLVFRRQRKWFCHKSKGELWPRGTVLAWHAGGARFESSGTTFCAALVLGKRL